MDVSFGKKEFAGARNFFWHFDSGHYHKPRQPRSAHFARCARDRSFLVLS